MTDLLTRDPNDTGEIPRADPGQTTCNLAPYEADLPPVLRRPDVTGEFPAYHPETIAVVEPRGCRRVVPNDEDFDFDPDPTTPHPDPLPPPPPPRPDQGAAQPIAPLERVIDFGRFERSTIRVGAYGLRKSVPYVLPADREPWTKPRHRRPAAPARAWAWMRGAR